MKTLAKKLICTGVIITLVFVFVPMIGHIASGVLEQGSKIQTNGLIDQLDEYDELAFSDTPTTISRKKNTCEDEQKKKCVTISFPKNYLLDEASKKSIGFREELKVFFSKYSKLSMINFHVVVKIDPTSDEESRVFKILEELNAFEYGLEKHRVILCETDSGIIHIVRHLHPELHIDYCSKNSKSLLPHIKKIYYLVSDTHSESNNDTTGPLYLVHSLSNVEI